MIVGTYIIWRKDLEEHYKAKRESMTPSELKKHDEMISEAISSLDWYLRAEVETGNAIGISSRGNIDEDVKAITRELRRKSYRDSEAQEEMEMLSEDEPKTEYEREVESENKAMLHHMIEDEIEEMVRFILTTNPMRR